MTELKQIIKQVKEACKENDIHPTDDQILESAQKIFVSGNISDNSRQGQRQQANLPKPPFVPATDGQKNALKKHGYKGDLSKLSKREAMQLIKEGVGE